MSDRPIRSLATLAMLCAACASGGRDTPPATPDGGDGPDAATPDTSLPDPDARVIRMDSATPPVDARVAVDGGSGIDAGPGTDAAVETDAATPTDSGVPECTTAADCSDGLACNGVEPCIAGSCGTGTPIPCDDGIGCTVDRCVEPGTCSFTPMDSLCAAGETCSTSLDCMSSCSESPCRLVSPQCGCPAGQGCYNDSTGTRTCRTAGSFTAGQACTGTGSCAPGNLCIDIDPVGTALLCSHYCNTDSDCAANELCVITLGDGAGGALPGITLCTHDCNPARVTGCPTGAACDFFQESGGLMRTFTDCTAPVGTGTQDALCATTEDCAPGYGCLDVDGAGGFPPRCLHWCEAATGVGCSIFDICYSFVTPLVVGGIEYGVCDF